MSGSSRDAVKVEKLSLVYQGGGGGAVKALEDVSLSVRNGEVVSIVGPSGCGKTTLANIILGLIPSEARVSGSVRVYDIEIIANGSARGNPARLYKEVGVGYVSQQDTLLPWKTLLDNVSLPLRIRGRSKDEAVQRAKELLDIAGLRGFENSYPHQLSGGMRQRAQLARALITDPRILVMDEPFGALDALTRVMMQGHLLRILSISRKTTIVITHDLEEAITLGDRVVVMTRRPGRVKASFEIRLPRGGDPLKLRSLGEFEELKGRIWSVLSEEMSPRGED